MISVLRNLSLRTALLLAALALYAPRGLMPPGFMPGTNHAGRTILMFCDPALRTAFGGHVHTHGHDAAGGDFCPFGMSGGPALLADIRVANATAGVVERAPLTSHAPHFTTRPLSANRARAPPVA